VTTVPPNGLRIKSSISLHEEDGLNETGYKLVFEILETGRSDLPVELLLFRRVMSQRIDKVVPPQDGFITVCTLSDIFEYPANAPSNDKRFFRKSKLEGVLPTLEEAQRVLARLEDLLQNILRSAKAIDKNMVETERIIVV
jgi:hypothetical protein